MLEKKIIHNLDCNLKYPTLKFPLQDVKNKIAYGDGEMFQKSYYLLGQKVIYRKLTTIWPAILYGYECWAMKKHVYRLVSRDEDV